ncbi:MAG: alpha/beta hydrolase-fold protein [bacterium]|nr:alpha/beta hydrolase-fold protein [bacterium]
MLNRTHLWVSVLWTTAQMALAVSVHYDQSFYSAALKETMYYDIILPDTYTNDQYFPVLYLLPGRNARYYTWRGNLDLLTFMQGKTFIAVVADTRNTWYMGAWAQYICRDLPAHIEKKWRASNIRGIAGISMGGYGAFYVAGYGRGLGGVRYHSLSALSGAFVEPWVAAFLDGASIVTRAQLADALASKPFRILFDCGNEDRFNYWVADYDLAYRNDLMRDELLVRGRVLWTNLFYYRPPGAHDYSYWNSRAPIHLAFHQQQFSLYPFVMVTSHAEFVTTVVTSELVRVAGVAYAGIGLSNVTWESRADGMIRRGVATGTNAWYADLTNQIGRNTIVFTARAVNNFTNWTALTLFRRNPHFRVRRIKVTPRALLIRTSDVTFGNVDALTNGTGGIGTVTLDQFSKALSNGWTRSGPFMARYSERTPDWAVTMTINGDARKDVLTMTCKPRGSNPLTNFFDRIRITNNVPLTIQLGAFHAQTNVTLNVKGVYSDHGPWF